MKKTFFVFVLCAASILLAVSCRCGRKGDAIYSDADTLRFAQYLGIFRADGYTVVDILSPWREGKILRRYILVPRDTDVPESLPEGTLIRTPVRSMVIYSGVHTAVMEELGCASLIKGVCEPEYITSGYIHKGISDGSIVGLGSSFSPDIERLISISPEVIIAVPFENGGYGAAEKTGIPIVEAADYMENLPLGRTEWLRFFGLLTGKERTADSLVSATAGRYSELCLSAAPASSAERPTVMAERKYGGSWGVAGRDSYMAVLYRDAGARYLFDDVPGTGSVKMSFEEVLEKGIHADFWLLKYASADRPFTYGALKEEYPPYAEFDAFRQRHIFACNTLTTPYYQDILLHPDRILASLISVFHPEINLPEGKGYRYFVPLGE